MSYISDNPLLLLCSAVGEPDSGMVKVAEWQQTMYSVDSGIQSGATTVRDDDGDYTTSKHYTMTTTVTQEAPGKTTSKTQKSQYANYSLCFIEM